MDDNDLVLKNLASHPVPGMINENHKNICLDNHALVKVFETS
jgi:hypothetical protein